MSALLWFLAGLAIGLFLGGVALVAVVRSASRPNVGPMRIKKITRKQ